MRSLAPLASLAFCALLTGCGGLGYHKQINVEHPRVELESGLTWQDELAGVGDEARPGDELVVDYTAWLEDGTRFDSSLDRGVPVEFILGEAPLKGWDSGLAGMHAGGVRRMWIPPALAYGSEGVPGLVPPDATLEFLIELHEVRREGEPPLPEPGAEPDPPAPE